MRARMAGSRSLMAASGRFAKKRSLFLFWAVGTAGFLALGLAILFKMNVLVAAVSTATVWMAATVVELALRHTLELVARQQEHAAGTAGGAASFQRRALCADRREL